MLQTYLTPPNHELARGLSWCIAGGYAACPVLAGDMDVWLFGAYKPDMMGLRRMLLALTPNLVPEDNPPMDSPERYFGAQYTLKVGHIFNVENRVARHILLTEAPTIEDLLNGFDISTHQCAYTPDGVFVPGAHWTPLREMPKILRMSAATPARFDKIAARYASFRCSEVAA